MRQRSDRRTTRRLILLRFAACVSLALLLPLAAAGQVHALAVLPGSVLLVWLGSRGMRRPGGVPVIVYHSIAPEAGWLPWSDSITVRPEVFRRHMQVLRNLGRIVVSSSWLRERRESGASVDPRWVVLHFDDGYLDNMLHAAPILREFGHPATIFVSADFIDPGRGLRSQGIGYMNADELRAMDADPLIEIASHGLDHGRIAVSDRIAGHLDAGNWRGYAPHVWALSPGPKARWFEADGPAPLRLGDPIRQSDSKLCGRWWRDGAQEDEAARNRRVEAELREARARLEGILGREVRFLCWPFDRWTPAARRAAEAAGFRSFTGGRGENRPDEDPTVLSRVHVHDHAFGGGPLWLEDLAFRAKLGSMSGTLYWAPLVMAASLIRRRRFARPGVHA
ncbi:polysaccharide deacetylase family protein [Cereibacter sphaeroides]|uniref:polysaccharide deacetylase family protein n=1 Tax=Cereibacter sphaeroides TaxID=1063 RepID=UPI001F42E2FB|nr:polysaccharide deacetylase family protein [Cereibacter sphaeroides]MCE6953151.1 polysaccharide deacetylase family protein [Cereibacter sphaeroides]